MMVKKNFSSYLNLPLERGLPLATGKLWRGWGGRFPRHMSQCTNPAQGGRDKGKILLKIIFWYWFFNKTKQSGFTASLRSFSMSSHWLKGFWACKNTKNSHWSKQILKHDRRANPSCSDRLNMKPWSGIQVLYVQDVGFESNKEHKTIPF